MGVDQVIARIAELGPAFTTLLIAGCYILGMIFVFSAIMGLRKMSMPNHSASAQNRVGGPIASFLLGALLCTLPNALGVGLSTVWGSDNIMDASAIAYNDAYTGPVAQPGRDAIHAVLLFVQVLGWVAFARGIVGIRNTANGIGSRTYGASITFIIGGVLAANIPQFTEDIRQLIFG